MPRGVREARMRQRRQRLKLAAHSSAACAAVVPAGLRCRTSLRPSSRPPGSARGTRPLGPAQGPLFGPNFARKKHSRDTAAGRSDSGRHATVATTAPPASGPTPRGVHSAFRDPGPRCAVVRWGCVHWSGALGRRLFVLQETVSRCSVPAKPSRPIPSHPPPGPVGSVRAVRSAWH